MPQLPKIAIVGRPNVGKSSLFNRLIGRRQAIVDDIPGVTRDRQYGRLEWDGRHYELIDTGGIVPGATADSLALQIGEQVQLALAEADLILFVVDGRAGLKTSDELVGEALRLESKPVLLVVNKIDGAPQLSLLGDFYRLGYEKLFGISAESSYGLSDLLECAAALLPDSAPGEEEDTAIKLTILGQPNVGKSTLLNALIGQDRAVVHNQAGTTVDPLRVVFERGAQHYEVIDTAGIRRKSRSEGKVEIVSVLKAIQCIEKADIVLLVVDATHNLSAQDVQILGYAEEKGRGVLMLLNKWDLVPAEKRLKELRPEITQKLKRAWEIPVLALSAKTGRGIAKIFPLLDGLIANARRRIPTGELNRVFQKATEGYPHPNRGGRNVHFYYITQVATQTPEFVIFCNHPDLVDKAYRRYLEKQLREHFDFSGTPMRLRFRKKS